MDGLKLACLALVALTAAIQVQGYAQDAPPEWHPALKALWQDQSEWRVIGPEDVNIDPESLIGLRVAYRREEGLVRNPLTEDAAFQFERGWLGGEPIVIGRFFTSGDPDRADSGPTYWTQMMEPTFMGTLASLSFSTRFGSFARRVTDTGSTSWRLGADASEWTEPETIEGHERMLDLAAWGQILAGIPMEEGMKFRLQAHPSWIGPAFHVAGRTVFQDTEGKSYDVWAVETNMGTAGWIGTTYMSTEAPLFVGFEMKHVESGDVNIRWRLKSYRWLGVD